MVSVSQAMTVAKALVRLIRLFIWVSPFGLARPISAIIDLDGETPNQGAADESPER